MTNGYVALTFDDGPNPDSTSALLAALTAERARATFFVWGERAARHPGYLRALRSAGMWLGNHAFTHPYLTRMDPAETHREIADTQRAVGAATGRPPTLFRPPYGDTDERVRTAAGALGLTEVLWTVDTRDWDGASADDIVAAAETVQPGGIILMHEGHQTTIDAVPRILNMLAARGLRPGGIAPSDGVGSPAEVVPAGD